MDAEVAAAFPIRWCARSPAMASRLRGRFLRAAARLEETKRKSEAKDSTLGGAPVFISKSGNGRGFIVATISVAVAAEDGNIIPRSRARFRTPSVAAKDPMIPVTVLSETDMHSSDSCVKVVLEYLTGSTCRVTLLLLHCSIGVQQDVARWHRVSCIAE